MTTAAMNRCPDCMQALPETPGLLVTSIVVCAACQAELEVISLNPAEFALAPEIEEDFGE
jgi:alpha-aminoadipate carrier protein LysW